MRRVITVFIATAAAAYILACCTHLPQPPVAPKEYHLHIMHGDTRVDPYYWLNQRDTERVLAYLEAENSYTSDVMRHTKGMQKKLYDEMRARIKEDDLSVPIFENGYYYYIRYELGYEYPIYCRRKSSMDAEEEVFLNVNELAQNHSYYSVVGVSISPNNNIVAFGVDTVSRRQYTIHFKDLTTGKLLESKISNTTGGIAWANDNKTVFYSTKDNTLRPWQIYRHRIDSPTSEPDMLVYQENDPTFSTFVFTDKSKTFIMVGSESTLSTEYWFLDANNPSGKFKVIQPRTRGLEYTLSHFNGNFYITTNLNAKNFRLMVAPVSNPGIKNWRDLIPYCPNILLIRAEVFSNYLVLSERSNGLMQIRIIDWDTRQEHYLDFGEEAYSTWLPYNPEFNTNILRYSYSSLTTPMSVFEYNMNTRERTLIKQTEVLGDFCPSNYETKRLWATATDSTRIPISLVYRKGLTQNGNNPSLLYAYGAYGYSFDPYFEHTRLSLLDRGFVYAIAHVRGGEELGRQWYEGGKMFNKINTFTDFIACAEFLIEQNYTNPEKLFAMGGSAGGLLMGVVANKRSDLFKGIIAQVPFVDVVTTMLDTTLPLTTSEYDEWGNPNDPESYFYMKSYSPYDQVRAQAYTNMLVTTGYHDSQVQYFEPAKWVARLRALKTDNNILLLKTDMESGHGGASGRFKALEDTAFEYSFMFKLLGMEI